MENKIKILLGSDKGGNLVWGKFSYDNEYEAGKADFWASFDICMPFQIRSRQEEQALIKKDISETINEFEMFDREKLYGLCDYYQCDRDNLLEKMADSINDIRDIYDCSAFNKCYEIDGSRWYFLFQSSGQYDTRKTGMLEYTNKEVYDEIHELWDAFHLKVIDRKTLEKIKALIDKCSELHLDDEDWMEEWISDYIRRNRKILKNNEPY